jgi:hypothetical protein
LASANTLSTIFASKTSLRQHSFESIKPVTGLFEESSSFQKHNVKVGLSDFDSIARRAAGSITTPNP